MDNDNCLTQLIRAYQGGAQLELLFTKQEGLERDVAGSCLEHSNYGVIEFYLEHWLGEFLERWSWRSKGSRKAGHCSRRES